jgi:uncharacterized membrane protein YphA (DoxX/SURF4 family)
MPTHLMLTHATLQLGLEYTLMWTIAAFYFLAHGGGPYSLDALMRG